ncbi:Scarecrow-like protein 9 [Dichanthelium oligosanthes]|uniref:Scarecrow-like protein 9 n=1 Tax=Dichanthelium oligosanthes TaxID=888268 RepID=A0A1E5WAU3_9POAL|nr:Scarecrow-like protein 9 [Dichanthelium oligosanthes]
MAATPESTGTADAEPFSPSAFLDLPPTPRPVGDFEDPAASSDDLVLPFISRMLMEEDIDDKFFYHYPDHPALLQVQQPYAQILSDAAAASDSFTANNNGSDSCTLSPSSDALSFANATRAYHPACPGMGAGIDEFAAHDVNQLFFPQQDAASARFPNGIESSVLLDGAEETTKTTTSPPTVEGEHGAPASTFPSFSGQNRVSMDMLNQAFLRGMEEAKKFLPTDNSLLVEARGSKLSQGIAAGEVRTEEKVDAMLTFQGIGGNGRGRKNRCNWQHVETETNRNSKLMVPEPEETGEMVDEIIVNEYRLCLNGMLGMRIAMDSRDGKNISKGNGKSALGRQRSNEVVDLHTLLIHCAQAVSMDDRQSATRLLRRIRQHSSPIGDANQRLAHCFAEGLEARLAGMGSQVYKSLKAKRTSLVEYLKAYQLYLTVCCFKMMAYRFSNMTIANAIAGRKKLHIVDYGLRHGIQWPSLLGWLATREGGPPEVRITGIDLPQPGFRPAAQIKETGRRLSKCAHQFGVPFKFQSIAAKWETVCVGDLNIDRDEVLVINGLFDFGNLMDEGVDIYSPSPRDVVLSNIRKMQPDVFILCNINGSHAAPFFVTRFREVLFFFSALFDMLDATVPWDNDQRLLVERDLFGRFAMNVIACEGSDRVERHETYKQWQVRNHRAGLQQLPLDPDIVKVVRKKVKDGYHKDFVIDVDNQWLLEGWKGRIICAMSTWIADDDFSEH